MKTTTFFLIGMALMLLAASAASAEEIKISAETLSRYKDQINSLPRGQNSALDKVRDQFADDVVELYIEDTGKTVTVDMKGGQLHEVTEGSSGRATIKIKASESAIKEISESTDPAKALVQAINSDKISYEATSKAGILKRILFWISKILMKIAALFMK